MKTKEFKYKIGDVIKYCGRYKFHNDLLIIDMRHKKTTGMKPLIFIFVKPKNMKDSGIVKNISTLFRLETLIKITSMRPETLIMNIM